LPKKTEEELFEEKFWMKVNRKCETCKHQCKQSSKVDIMNCPMFENEERQ
jgi:hypothetical protein